MGPHFYLALRQIFLGSQAKREFLGSRGSRGQSLNWRFYFYLFFLSLFPSTEGNKSVSKFCGDWVLGLVGPHNREGKTSAIPSQAGCLGVLSPNLPRLWGYPFGDTALRLELGGGVIT